MVLQEIVCVIGYWRLRQGEGGGFKKSDLEKTSFMDDPLSK